MKKEHGVMCNGRERVVYSAETADEAIEKLVEADAKKIKKMAEERKLRFEYDLIDKEEFVKDEKITEQVTWKRKYVRKTYAFTVENETKKVTFEATDVIDTIVNE